MSRARRPIRVSLWVLLISCFGFLVLDVLFFGTGLELNDVSTWGPWLGSRLSNWRFLLPLGPPLGAILVLPLLKERETRGG